MMRFIDYTIRFVTPAFLGDANQQGAWRTPPFKALLRQWWRVAVASDCNYDHHRIREKEGRLFGHAWLSTQTSRQKTWAMKSRVLLRLKSWRSGELLNWEDDRFKVSHPEVDVGGGKIDPFLYLGYGPLFYRKGTKLKEKTAIAAGETAKLSIGFPQEEMTMLSDALQLMHWFGTVGSRSRNGWGSFIMDGEGIDNLGPFSADRALLQRMTRPLDECLQQEWPHALGIDKNRLLIWRTRNRRQSWKEVMRELAKVKIDFRVGLPFVVNKGKNAGGIDKRHVLAYPVTNHSVTEWGRKERLANQIRFKVIKDKGGFFGLVYHLPCRVPRTLLDRLNPNARKWVQEQELSIWREVHVRLDEHELLELF